MIHIEGWPTLDMALCYVDQHVKAMLINTKLLRRSRDTMLKMRLYFKTKGQVLVMLA